jgi:hypothetical protein
MTKKKLRVWTRIVAVGGCITLVVYIFFQSTTPFGASMYTKFTDRELVILQPADRVQLNDGIARQLRDLVYMPLKVSHYYDQAKVKIVYRNNSIQQRFFVGYKDQVAWHYHEKLVDAPLLNSLRWSRVGNGPYVYQKQQDYPSTEKFLANIPTNKIIGVYDYDAKDFQYSKPPEDYKPATTNTVINTPLRGSFNFYAYVGNEHFRIKFTKKDLNRFEDPDPVLIKVVKDGKVVAAAAIADDGNGSSDRVVDEAQNVEIKNPGPALPEPGVYKIFVESTNDSVITGIETNLHKIVFEGPLYPVESAEVYKDLVQFTKPTQLYTDAIHVSALTRHNQSLQPVSIGAQTVQLYKTDETVNLKSSGEVLPLTLPKSNTEINGVGYFAFASEHFFKPTPYHILPITSKEELERVDYVVTNYVTPKSLGGGWYQAERSFDLHDAVVQKGRLSWVFKSPDLRRNSRSIDIRSIEMTLTKEGW